MGNRWEQAWESSPADGNKEESFNKWEHSPFNARERMGTFNFNLLSWTIYLENGMHRKHVDNWHFDTYAGPLPSKGRNKGAPTNPNTISAIHKHLKQPCR